MTELKKCSNCKLERNKNEFWKNRTKKDGLDNVCRPCRRVISHYSSPKRRSPTYSVSLEQFTELERKQEGKCAICGNSTKLCIDHCHKTETVRGLLCTCCNGMLGFAKDNESILLKAIEYLTVNKQYNKVEN